MLRNNRIFAIITTLMTTNVLSALAAMEVAIRPLLVNLTPKERNQRLKVGNKQFGLIMQLHRICELHPEFMPGIHSAAEFETKVRNLKELRKMQAALAVLEAAISDTLLVANDEALRISLDYYKGLKIAAKSNEPGAMELYQEVRANFTNVPKQKKTKLTLE
jgi:hypothetical protein